MTARSQQRSPQVNRFLEMDERDLIYLYHMNPAGPDGQLAKTVIEYKNSIAMQRQSDLLFRQNRHITRLTVAIAIAAVCQAFAALAQLYYQRQVSLKEPTRRLVESVSSRPHNIEGGR